MGESDGAAPREGPDASKAVAPAGRESEEDWATRYKYLLADFENYRKRTERERESAQDRIRASLLRSLLPIYESFERARRSLPPSRESESLRQGIELLETEWERLLREEGVVEVARVKEPFSPEEQEAVGEISATDQFPDGAVAEIVQQGYRFRGGLLRPAKVVVARTVVETAEPSPTPGNEPSTSGEGP